MDALLEAPLDDLLAAARERRRGGGLVTYSPKVFIPLTTLCRDVCGYCTFARPPRRGERAYMTEDEVLAIARAGAAAGCTEALFTLGDKPELRYQVAREELARARLRDDARVPRPRREARARRDRPAAAPEPGRDEPRRPRARCGRSRPRWGSCSRRVRSGSRRRAARTGPRRTRLPARRLETIALAGELRIPFTSGILIGIGETRAERLEALLALRALHERHGHLQEVIVQNFRAKPGTRMAAHPEPSLDDQLWTIAAARLLLPADVSVQAPPNLAYDDFPRLLDAGIDDWGGVSPVTIDHVNPEAPWPELERLAAATRSRGLELAPRLPVYPRLPRPASGSTRPCCRRRCAPPTRSGSRARTAGTRASRSASRSSSAATRCRSTRRDELGEEELVRLFRARGEERQRVFAAADRLRREVYGDEVSYVVTRNIQYTNVCYFRCGFCAFSKGKLAANLRGAPYLVPHEEIVRRARRRGSAARPRSASRAASTRRSPATTTPPSSRRSGTSCPTCTSTPSPRSRSGRARRRSASRSTTTSRGCATLGLGSLPGTAAEILDDEVRAVICPDKVSTDAVARGARGRAPRRPALERDDHVRPRRARPSTGRGTCCARASSRQRTGGFTEFVPLPFVHMEAPM